MATSNDFTAEELLADLFKCVSVEALKNENVEKYDIKIHGTEDKIEQYGSDIAFVDINAEKFDAEKRKYNFVLKYGHTQKNVRNKVPIREGFKREIQVYDKLVPCYQRFLLQKGLPLLDAIPKCYLTKFSDTDEIIVLQDLKTRGYQMHNRKSPMDIDHIKLVLEAYAQWHALSFALDDQKDAEYLEVKEFFRSNPWKSYFENQLGELIDIGQKSLYAILEQNGQRALLKQYKQKIGKAKARTVLTDLMEIEEKAVVVLHGDCWNNNFLFQYEEISPKKKRCSKVAILDFQTSTLRSPIFDLSHFLYSVASSKELERFEELIEHYYAHLSLHLDKLGSSVEEIFPFGTLKAHWKKYSAYGAILSPFIAMYCFIDKENTADFGVCQTLKNATLKHEYMKRVMEVARHFVEFKF